MSRVDGDEPEQEEQRKALDALYGEMKGVEENPTRARRRKPLDHERKGRKSRQSPVVDYVRSLGDYKVTSEVAEELGVSPAYIRKLAETRATQAPSYRAPFGHTHVNLYTEEDVGKLRDYIASKRIVYPRDEYPFDEES